MKQYCLQTKPKLNLQNQLEFKVNEISNNEKINYNISSFRPKTFIRNKSLLLTIVFCMLVKFCLIAEPIKLPKEPWRAIVFMEKYSAELRWKKNISIQLFGSFTTSDSLMVDNAITTLNELCETVNLSFSKCGRGNLEIFFLDSINDHLYESIVNTQDTDEQSNSKIEVNYKKTNVGWFAKSIRHYKQSFRLGLIPEDIRQNFITNKLAYALFPKRLPIEYAYEKGQKIHPRPVSIFNTKSWEGTGNNSVEYNPPFSSELSYFDRELLKAVNASNYPELLSIAKKQYYQHPLWINQNARKLMIFPFVIVLFLFAGLIILFNKKIGVKIKNKFLRFNILSILCLLIIGIIASAYIVISSRVESPSFSFFNAFDIMMGIFIFTILGLPALNIIRLIELAIHKKAQHKYFKVLLLFLSTSFIPSLTLYSIYFFLSTRSESGGAPVEVIIVLFLVFLFIGFIRSLISFFILKEKEIKIESEVKFAKLRELKSRAELNALHSKINPHFLYNSLNSIAGLALLDAKKTEKMALSLSKLFRYSINKGQSDWSTFEEEMEMARIYLNIEKVRFDDRLAYTVDLPNELKTVKVPRFIIQPLVENAVKHGVSKILTTGKITASVSKNNQWIEIIVKDNGPDFPKELMPGFGLQSIYDKLEIMYPNRFELHFLNSPNKHILIKLL